MATALFSLLIVERVAVEIAEPVLALAINAVWISAVLHGISAAPVAKWYGARIAAKAPENIAVTTSAKPFATRSR